MIAINVQGLLSITRAALAHLLQAAQDSSRQVADIVNISSIAGRVAWNGYGVYNMTSGRLGRRSTPSTPPPRPRTRGHRRRHHLHGHPTAPRLHRRVLDHAHRPGLT